MSLLLNIVISAVTAAVAFFGVYNYAPQNILSLSQTGQPSFGATSITNIAGTDTLSASRTVINNNFSSLNTNKLEITDLTASTTLTLGTVTTGVWNATAIGVGYGGTGTTSPTLNQIMFGNGSSGLKVIGFGSSGQFLTSGGASVAPSWTTASIDTSLPYNWTGLHSFAATTTMATSTVASTTITTLNTTATSTFVGGVAGIVNYQVFTASGTWTKPANVTGNEEVFVQVWGAGGGGGNTTTCQTCNGGAGGGGSYIEGKFRASDLTSTVTVTVAGTASANAAGGSTTFGSYITAYGGGAGGNSTATNAKGGNGGGGGSLSVGSNGANSASGVGASANGGSPLGGNSTTADSAFGGGYGVQGSSGHGGGGGSGSSVYGGAGGQAFDGNNNCGTLTAGTSVFGGTGGALGNSSGGGNGVAPAGGGGGACEGGSSSSHSGGTGARGEVRVWLIR